MFINYKRTVDFSTVIINAGLNQDNLITCAQKTTSGAPAADANKYVAGAIVQNVASGIVYINAGSSASPSWEAIEAGTIALASGQILVGNAGGVATAVAMSGDASISNTGAVTVAGTSTERVAFIPATAPQALSGAGAINLTSYQTRFTSTGAGDALTLANATRTGLLKKVSYIAEGAGGDTGVITPTTASGFTTVTLNAVGDYVVFMWNGSAWIVVDFVGATVA